ncbi:MAG: hypothetical protein HY064_13075 [Bacteroidetes bacterium]|nr:hypothetical protein [Bacteroidota bacterium]
MKKYFILPIACFLMCALFSCAGNKKKENAGTLKKDSVKTAASFILDELLQVADENELKKKFGAGHISYDTIWGAEGGFVMGTFIDRKTSDEVQILWKDSLHRAGVEVATLDAMYVENGGYDFNNKWTTTCGIYLGMTSDELEQLNGKDFKFSGFGWDYGGGISSWNEGKLEKAGIGIMLTEANHEKNISQKEMESLLGDKEFSSADPLVKKLQPQVVTISVSAR